GEHRGRIVFDRRIAHADVGALREPMLVAEVELLGAVLIGLVGRRHSRAARGRTDRARRRRATVRAGDRLRLRVRAADRAHAYRYRERDAVAGGLAIAERRLVVVVFVGEAHVHHAEVPAALDGVAGVGLANYGEVLVAIHCRADPRPAAHASPLQRRGDQGRIG